MKLAIIVWLVIIVAGCSTEITRNDLQSQFTIQYPRTTSAKSVKVIDLSALKNGDILLSSSTSVRSWGIRLFGLSGVSHAAVYIGHNQVAEAVGSGVNITSLEDAISESNNLLALRMESLSQEQAEHIRAYTLAHQGQKYNYKGIVMYAPFMLTRRICELPLTGAAFRDRCLTTLASIQLSSDRPAAAAPTEFFCSEFVVSAFADAGAPLFSGEAQWVGPGDLLHMREGDVSAYKTTMKLRYVGHLKRWDLAEILTLRRQ